MPYDWSVTAQPTSVSGSEEYPAQTFSVSTDVGTFNIEVSENQLEKGYVVIKGENPEDNVQGINSALSGVSGTKTPLVGYSIVHYDEGGNEIAPLSDLYIQVVFTPTLISSHTSYQLVFKDYGGSYTAVRSSAIAEASNAGLTYFWDEVGAMFLVGID